MITPKAGPSVITGIQFATANDMPDRDPVYITIEGSNDPHGAEAEGNGFNLLYEGVTGLDNNQDRNSWGRVVEFKNATAYASYRVLVTEVSGFYPDATQYSEVRMGSVRKSFVDQ